jgi:hypothetical protein
VEHQEREKLILSSTKPEKSEGKDNVKKSDK